MKQRNRAGEVGNGRGRGCLRAILPLRGAKRWLGCACALVPAFVGWAESWIYVHTFFPTKIFGIPRKTGAYPWRRATTYRLPQRRQGPNRLPQGRLAQSA